MRLVRHIFIVRNHNNGGSVNLVQLRQDVHNFVTHGAVQVAGRLIGKDGSQACPLSPPLAIATRCF